MMYPPTVSRLVALIAFSTTPALAQGRGATISGVVVDSARQPVAGAEVTARPGNHRALADSLGRFRLTGLDGGTYVVAARKVGYAPDRWDATLSDNGRIDIRFTLARRVLQLDTLAVTARADCPAFTLRGFYCRRHYGGAVYLDLPDIDDAGVTESAQLFTDLPGFRVDIQSVQGMPVRVVRLRNRSGCISALVDGRPASPANVVPRYAADLVGLEVYPRPDSVPEVYQRYTWPGTGASRTGRCALVVYWTVWARVD